MKKKLWIVLLSLMMIVSLFFVVACSTDVADNNSDNSIIDQNDDDDNDETIAQDKVFTASDVAAWSASVAPGAAEIEDSKVKVYSTATGQSYGGVASASFKANFTDQVYVTLKDFEMTDNTCMIFKMKFTEYSGTNSAFLVSDDMLYLNGDLTFNVESALKKYISSSDNSRLFYSAGDKDSDGNTIAENSDLIGTLKFAGNTSVSLSVDIWCFSLNGSDSKSLKFSEMKVESKEGEVIENFALEQSDLTNENAVTIGDDNIMLNSLFTPSSVENSKVIYYSKDPSTVTISENGEMSFVGVTSEPTVIYAVPMGDITKAKTLEVEVKGNINSQIGIKAYFESLSYDLDGAVNIDENAQQILEGTLLNSQKIKSSNNDTEYARGYVYNNKYTLINAYSSENQENASLQNYALTLNLAVNNQDFLSDASATTVSIYKITTEKIIRMYDSSSVVANGDKYEFLTEIYFAENEEKVTEGYNLVAVWINGDEITTTNTVIDIVNANSIGAYLNATELNNITSVHQTFNGYEQVVEDDLLKLNLNSNLSGDHFAQPNFKVYTNAKEGEDRVVIDFTKNVKMLIEIESSYAWLNVRFLRINGNWYTSYWVDSENGYNYNNVLQGNKNDTTGSNAAGDFIINVDHFRDMNSFASAIDAAIADPDGTVEFNLDFQYGGAPLDAAPYGYINIRSVTFFYVD